MKNAILIDIDPNVDSKPNKKLKFGTRLFKNDDYIFNTDNILRYVQINEKVINRILKQSSKEDFSKLGGYRKNKLKNKLEKKLSKFLVRVINKGLYCDYTCILSKNIHSDIGKLEYIKEILEKNNVKPYESENTILKNDILNIEEYIKKRKSNASKIKILILCKDLNNFDLSMLLKYIDRYKYVDILKEGKKDENLLKIIEKTNIEYGTSISIIHRKNIYNYDIYVNVDLNDDSLERYIMNKRNLIINLYDSEDDIFNENVIAYEKNRKFLGHFLNLSNFKKCETGQILTDSV